MKLLLIYLNIMKYFILNMEVKYGKNEPGRGKK